MRSFASKSITIPVAFKAIHYRSRAQLWNRQASIIMDLTVLAFRNGWCCFPISVPALVTPSGAVITRPNRFQTDHQIKTPGAFAWIESEVA